MVEDFKIKSHATHIMLETLPLKELREYGVSYLCFPFPCPYSYLYIHRGAYVDADSLVKSVEATEDPFRIAEPNYN